MDPGKHAGLSRYLICQSTPGNPHNAVVGVNFHESPLFRLRIFPQNQRRHGIMLLMKRAQGSKIEVYERIGVEHQHRLAGKMLFRLFEAASRTQDHRLARIDDPQPVPRTIPERLLDHRPKVMQVDDDIVEPVLLQEQEIPHNQGGAGDGEQRLGNRVRERSQTSSQPRCEDHGFHKAL
jgi:hypothetical protein